MRTDKRLFSPAIVPAIATLTGFLLLMALGFWQLQRAEEKDALYGSFYQKSQRPPVDLGDVSLKGDDREKFLWRKARAWGRYPEDKVFLLDNQVVNGEPGYFVFSAFAIRDRDARVMVNRGWVPAGGYRDVLPDIHTPREALTITGTLVQPPSSGIRLGPVPEEEMKNNISRMQNIDLEVLQEILGYDLLPYILQLDPSSAGGYTREWRLPGFGSERHKGYAFQWFALAAVLLIIYFSIYFRKHHAHE